MKAALESATPLKDYWLIAMKNSHLIEYITPRDEKILTHLTNITTKVNEASI